MRRPPLLARWLRSISLAPLLGALWLGDPGCAQEDPSTTAPAATPADPAAVVLSAEPAAAVLTLPASAPITYQLAWDWEGTAAGPSPGTHTLTTSLGYELSVEKMSTGTLSLELVPCSMASEARPARSWLAPRRAWADHAYTHDASLLSVATAEGSSGEARVFGVAKASGQPYCRLFALSGAVAGWTPDDLRMQGWSLYFRGSYARAGEAARPVEAFVGLGRGTLRELTSLAPLPASMTSAHVTLTRHVAVALDPIDFAALSPTDLAYEILERLGATATALVSAAP